jgi:hypothetical protein
MHRALLRGAVTHANTAYVYSYVLCASGARSYSCSRMGMLFDLLCSTI